MVLKSKENFLKHVNKLSDTKILYNKDNIVIIEVKSFNDCNSMFCIDSVNWCIAHRKNHWDGYVGKPNQHQYFIIDFNDINSINKTKYNLSLIGFTLNDGELMAAHARNDKSLLDNISKYNSGHHPFEQILMEKGIYDFVIKHKMKGGPTDCNSSKNDGMWLIWMLIGLILLAMCTLNLLIFYILL